MPNKNLMLVRIAAPSLLGLLAMSSWNAECATEPYNFVSEYIRELGAIEDIRADIEQSLKEKDDNKLADCIRNGTRYQLALRSDVAILKEMILLPTANSLIDAITKLYENKIDLYQELIDGCSTVIAGPQPNVDWAKILEEVPKIDAKIEFLDHTIFDATPWIFSTLIDKKEDSHHHLSHLVIKKNERDELVSKINSEFGKKLDENKQNYTVSSASLLRLELTKDYKCADDPWQ